MNKPLCGLFTLKRWGHSEDYTTKMKQVLQLVALAISTIAIGGCSPTPSASITVGTFNIHWFTASKSENATIVEYIAKIVSRYNLVLLTEIRDNKEGIAMHRLWKAVNNTGTRYRLAISGRLGRYPNFYTEEYGFFYDPSKVTLLGTYQYDDMPGNEFEREPYSVLVRSAVHGLSNYDSTAFISSHIQPKNAVNEMIEMKKVVDNVRNHWNVNRIVILGDLNADCRYMSASALDSTPLRADSSYRWLIPDTADTTVSTSTDCAYDRIIVTDNIKASNSSVFRFDTCYQLDLDDTKAVSDHYPVETTLIL